MGGRSKRQKRAATRALLPRDEWSDSTAPPVNYDSVGEPYSERDEKGIRLEHQSTDPNGCWFLGEIIRKEGTKCSGNTKQRDWGGPDTISDSELTRDPTIQVTSEPPTKKRLVFILPPTLPIIAPASFAPRTSAPSSTKERGLQKTSSNFQKY